MYTYICVTSAMWMKIPLIGLVFCLWWCFLFCFVYFVCRVCVVEHTHFAMSVTFVWIWCVLFCCAYGFCFVNRFCFVYGFCPVCVVERIRNEHDVCVLWYILFCCVYGFCSVNRFCFVYGFCPVCVVERIGNEHDVCVLWCVLFCCVCGFCFVWGFCPVCVVESAFAMSVTLWKYSKNSEKIENTIYFLRNFWENRKYYMFSKISEYFHKVTNFLVFWQSVYILHVYFCSARGCRVSAAESAAVYFIYLQLQRTAMHSSVFYISRAATHCNAQQCILYI